MTGTEKNVNSIFYVYFIGTRGMGSYEECALTKLAPAVVRLEVTLLCVTMTSSPVYRFFGPL